MNTFFIIFASCFLLNFNALSQNHIEANIENWEFGIAKIGTLDFITGDTQEFGSIDKSGNITIKLEPDFLQKMKVIRQQKNIPWIYNKDGI